MWFDNWSFREKFVFVWGLIIATVALVAVGVSLGNVISDNSSSIASWIQAIGALAIVWATYQLHYETKKKLDNELIEKKNIEISKAKFFLTQNSDIFMDFDIFIYHIELSERLIKQDFVEFRSVEFFRGMFRYIDKLNIADQKLTEMLSRNSVPDICVENIYKLLIITRKITSSFSGMTSQADVGMTLSMIGKVSEIKKDPIQEANAEYLEQYISPWVSIFISSKDDLNKEKDTLTKLIFSSQQ